MIEEGIISLYLNRGSNNFVLGNLVDIRWVGQGLRKWPEGKSSLTKQNRHTAGNSIYGQHVKVIKTHKKKVTNHWDGTRKTWAKSRSNLTRSSICRQDSFISYIYFRSKPAQETTSRLLYFDQSVNIHLLRGSGQGSVTIIPMETMYNKTGPLYCVRAMRLESDISPFWYISLFQGRSSSLANWIQTNDCWEFVLAARPGSAADYKTGIQNNTCSSFLLFHKLKRNWQICSSQLGETIVKVKSW